MPNILNIVYIGKSIGYDSHLQRFFKLVLFANQ